ncbi:uncharacterized protein STEHIDRAFT_166110 [Stereum hirsutum FP-91666 SS1]|uniref:uncharacterized protein n=1 Tax=Stereum hirsutum (strain FP-91666) TaxID=721885 RepID=UPI000440C72B|nr:uncharacterized protein STEHIDRAFT_166110 [Stereum hirsutum FP-91666 SS1]EIM89781.1 hypothetical protein STEHIDRAFT_166110 [Stereum hirsutum FP-91666 SS1]
MNRSASLGIASNTIAPPNASEEDRIGIHPEDRWDLPFLPPLATFEGAQDISEGRFDSVFGVEVDSLRSLIPLPSASPAITTPTSFPSNMDHRKMRELLDEPIPVHMSSCPSPSNLSPSSSASSGSPESRLSSSEEFYPAPGYSFSYDPTLGDSTYAPLHSFSVLTMQPGWTIGADISGYDHPSFTEPTVNPKLVVVSPPIENSDDSTEEEDEDEDEDEEMHVPASALIKKKPTKKPTPLSPTKTKRTNNTTKGRANTMTKVKAAAKKAHKKNSRGVWRPPPSLPKCCAKCKTLDGTKILVPDNSLQKEPPKRAGYRGSLLPRSVALSSSRKCAWLGA